MTATQHPVRVLKAQSAQSDLIANGFHCSADPGGLRAFGLELGDQVRVTRSPGAYALYTVTDVLPETGADVLRMGLTGRQRLGVSDRFEGVLDTEITRNALDDRAAEQQSELVERLDETDGLHTGLLVCAPHGGMIEADTAEQAELVYALLRGDGKDVSCWRCKGWNAGGGAYERWHVASTEISPRSFRLLGQIRDRKFRYAVAFHGYEKDDITVGGLGPNDLKCAIKGAILAIKGFSCEVHIADPQDAYAGSDPANLVNWVTAGGVGGIQIEQPARVRADFDREIAEAVASVLLRMP